MSLTQNVDVVVLGAGMAGLCAAAAAAGQGSGVLVVERAPTIGGSAALSHGTVWTASDTAELHRIDPGRYQRLGQSVIGGYDDAVSWLAASGAPVAGRVDTATRRAQDFDIDRTVLHLMQVVFSAGGDLWTSATTTAIRRVADRFRLTIGVDDGPARTVDATAVVIATGGRQADPAVRTELAGAESVLRGNPYSNGSGLALAQSLGAAANLDNRGFYGHLFPYGLRPSFGLDMLALAFYHSTYSVLLDRGGIRFTEEGRGDAHNAAALAAHGSDGLLVWSAAVQDKARSTTAPAGLALDRWQYAADRGGQVARVASITEAADRADEWGFGDTRLALSQAQPKHLSDGPIYLARVVPAMTFTYGGLVTTTDGRACSADGTQIEGLFVAGADVGDVYHEGYGGGLSLALVTGRAVGSQAARRAAENDAPTRVR